MSVHIKLLFCFPDLGDRPSTIQNEWDSGNVHTNRDVDRCAGNGGYSSSNAPASENWGNSYENQASQNWENSHQVSTGWDNVDNSWDHPQSNVQSYSQPSNTGKFSADDEWDMGGSTAGNWSGQSQQFVNSSWNNASSSFGHDSAFDDERRRGPDAGFGNDRYRGDDAGFGNDSRRDDVGFGNDRRCGPKADGRGAGRNDNSTVMEVDSGDVGRIIGLGNTVFVRHFVKPSNCFYFSYPNRCNLEYV